MAEIEELRVVPPKNDYDLFVAIEEIVRKINELIRHINETTPST